MLKASLLHLRLRRGLYKSIFGRIMSVHGQPAFKALSPLYAFQNGHAALWCVRTAFYGTAVPE